MLQQVNFSDNFNKNGLYALVVLFLLLLLFQLLPVVKDAQRYVSPENLKGAAATCDEILSDRAWYGRINHWFFAWLVFVPAFIFSITPNSPKWLRASRTILSVLICYGFMFLAVEHQWDIRNAPFRWHSDPVNSSSEFRNECDNIADGFSLIMALVMGWLPACLYVEICLSLWFQYYKRYRKIITNEYKADWSSRLLSFGMRIYLVAACISVLGLLAQIKVFGILGMVLLRPLFIPFEIFLY